MESIRACLLSKASRLTSNGLYDDVDSALALFDESVASSIELCSRMKTNLTPDHHRIPEEVCLLALEKNRLRRRWQRTPDLVEKISFNRAAGVLRRRMQAFRRSSWDDAVTDMAKTTPDDGSYYRISSSMTWKRRRRPLPAIMQPGGQYLCKTEEKHGFLAGVMERHLAPNPLWDPAAAQESRAKLG